jgi:hypothetical protein
MMARMIGTGIAISMVIDCSAVSLLLWRGQPVLVAISALSDDRLDLFRCLALQRAAWSDDRDLHRQRLRRDQPSAMVESGRRAGQSGWVLLSLD